MLNICKYSLAALPVTPRLTSPRRSSRLSNDWQVYTELFGNLIRLHPGYWSAHGAQHSRNRTSLSALSVRVLQSGPGGDQASLTGVTDVSSPRCGSPSFCCPALVFHVCGVEEGTPLCGFITTVWDSGSLTSLGCRGLASCLQVNTEEAGLVQTCTELEGLA